MEQVRRIGHVLKSADFTRDPGSAPVAPPPFDSSPAKNNVQPLYDGMYVLERVRRIELPSLPWQGNVLPLNHTREQPKERANNAHLQRTV